MSNHQRGKSLRSSQLSQKESAKQEFFLIIIPCMHLYLSMQLSRCFSLSSQRAEEILFINLQAQDSKPISRSRSPSPRGLMCTTSRLLLRQNNCLSASYGGEIAAKGGTASLIDLLIIDNHGSIPPTVVELSYHFLFCPHSSALYIIPSSLFVTVHATPPYTSSILNYFSFLLYPFIFVHQFLGPSAVFCVFLFMTFVWLSNLEPLTSSLCSPYFIICSHHLKYPTIIYTSRSLVYNTSNIIFICWPFTISVGGHRTMSIRPQHKISAVPRVSESNRARV